MNKQENNYGVFYRHGKKFVFNSKYDLSEDIKQE